MTHVQPDEQEEKPLDPAMESVRRKMIRLQVVSGGVMFISLMAVFGAVVYKATRPSAPQTQSVSGGGYSVPADQPLSARAALPAGFTVKDVSLSGGQVLFYGAMPEGAIKAYVFDLAAGRIVADIAVGAP